MDKEKYIIDSLSTRFIGDDGAVIGYMVYSKDIFAEDIHFKLGWMSLSKIAQKAMLVNISDAIVMNAKPKYALIGLIVPKYFSLKQIDKLTQGFNKSAKKWGVKIIGGDTTSGEKLVISITIISKTKNPVFRHGMNESDLLAYTGKLGSSLEGLNILLKGGKLPKNHRFIKPKLRDKFFYKAAPFISSALDISDGLSKDLSRLSSANNLGFHFIKKLSRSNLCSGEEYEILFSFPSQHKEKIQKIAKKTKTPITIFAFAKKGRYKSACKEHHFS